MGVLRTMCDECDSLLPMPEPPGHQEADWGGWKCPNCQTMYCHDCGAPINRETMQCKAYEASKADWVNLP